MKLHETLIDILVQTYETNSGWTEEKKLKAALRDLDFAIYTQQDGTKVLVSAAEMQEHFRIYEQFRAQQRELEAQRRGK